MIDKILQINIFTNKDWTVNLYDVSNNKYYKDVSDKTKSLLLDLFKQLEDDNNLHGDIW